MPDGTPTKHGLLAGDAAPPHRPDWTIEQDWERYTPAGEHRGVAVHCLYEAASAKLLPGAGPATIMSPGWRRCRSAPRRSSISAGSARC